MRRLPPSHWIAAQHEASVPLPIRRDIRLPDLPGKAAALIGMRRSGKTFRMLAEVRDLLDRGVPRSHILMLNLEDDRYGPVRLQDLDDLLEAFYRRDPTARSTRAFLFLDELQVVPDWERFARRVLDTENVRLVVTGSSARLLSTEVATHFRGRAVTVEVLPYSLREAARADGGTFVQGPWPPGSQRRSEMDAALLAYLRNGGFPAVRTLEERDRIQALQEYVDLVVLRDVAERHNAHNLPALRALVAALFAANANGMSINRLHGALRSAGMSVGKDTLHTYLGHLLDSFLFFLVPIRTRSARQRNVNPRKVYAIDPGLAAAMYRAGAVNRGAQLENTVYLSLRRQYGRLSEGIISWVRTASGKEVDFAVDEPIDGGLRLIQVCEDLSNAGTLEREVSALSEAMNELGTNAGTIVTLFDESVIQVPAGTIRVVPAREWFFAGAPRG